MRGATVASKGDIRAAIDNSRLTTRLSIIGGITSLILLVLTLVLGAVKGELVGADVFSLAVIPYSLALLFSISALIYGMLGTGAAIENEEKMLLAGRASTNALNVEEDVRFTAGRSFENYRRFAPYVLSVLAALLVAGLLGYFFRHWAGRPADAMPIGVDVATKSALFSAILMLVSVFAGAFFVGQSRGPAFRWLRPVGAWLVTGFAVMFVSTVAAIFVRNNIPAADTYAARVIFWLYAVLGLEFITNFVIEFYRPRTMRETRPIFESRLLALFTEPGGVMRNIAAALDYQFGFKVSGTWLYSFMERSFFPLVIIWAVILWGFTMIHEVGPSEVGVKERLGKVVETDLEPGIYWTLPWPFGEIRQFSCTDIHQVVIGELHDEKEEEAPEDDGHGHGPAPKAKKTALSPVVLWTAAHGGEDNNFIVAVPPIGKESSGRNSEASISFIRMVIPIDYQIRRDGVMNYGYKNLDPEKTLTRIGEQAATEYLASSSMMEVMSTDRLGAEAAMKKRIQELADMHELGIRIVAVTILDAHPPVEKVAPAYQNVIGAMEERETMIWKAKAYAAKTLPEAESKALQITSDAESYRYTTKTVAEAESGRFNTQLITYRAMPSMFRLRSYLDFLEKDAKDIRKFVIASGLSSEVYELNFEQKERLDLTDADITSVK
ncbi:hypothetical protein C8D82_10434 [Victivallis vadensis]|uniref:Band 7 domain-containing protein n=1 Tax=Victivallis vadensis TaxID=172901 RepID=A0A2U1B8C6_9BACT|nr:hypothetical protein C8D82_10434 [Victivallis vadensis]